MLKPKPTLIYLGGFLCGLVLNQEAKGQQVLLLNQNQHYTTIDLGQVSSIVFSDGHIKFNNGDCESDYYGLAVTEMITFDVSAGVSQANSQELLNVYPNPAENEFTLAVSAQSINSVAVLYSATGVEVKRWKVTNEKSQVNISDLANGVYYLRINNSTQKLVKS